MVVLQPSLPPGVTIAELIPENAIFSQTVQNYQLEFTISNHHSENVTVIVFDSATEGKISRSFIYFCLFEMFMLENIFVIYVNIQLLYYLLLLLFEI